MARHRVHRRAAFEQHDRTFPHRHIGAGQKAVVDAFFAIAHGELRIGREQKRRVGVMRAVVAHIAHARFLVRAENEAQRVRQLRRLAGKLQLSPQVHGVQRHHARAFVIDDATAHQVAVFARDLVGLEMPTGARRHHIHVANDAQLRGAFTRKVSVTHVALIVMRRKTHAFCQVKRRIKRPARPWTKGCAPARRAFILEAGNMHQRVNVGNNVFPMLIQIFLNALLQ